MLQPRKFSHDSKEIHIKANFTPSKGAPRLNKMIFTILTLWTIFESCVLASPRRLNSKEFVESLDSHSYRAVIHRRILPPAQGFHLEILSEVHLSSPLLTSSSESLNCSLRLTETLPSGLFVDNFQLKNFHQLGGPLVASRRPVDTEAPAFESAETALTVIHPFKLERPKQRLVSQVVLPVHVRYHRASANGDPTRVTLENPRADISCWDDATRPSVRSNQLGSWTRFDADAVTPVLKITVPCGDGAQAPWIIALTFLACLWAMTQLWMARPIDDKRKD